MNIKDVDENSSERVLDVFFYGLYMDPELITSRGALPRSPRKARIIGYALRIGKLATLLRRQGETVGGIVYGLTHKEIDQLYRGSGLVHHVPEALLAVTEDGLSIPVLCFNLLIPPQSDETNEEYTENLKALKMRLGVI